MNRLNYFVVIAMALLLTACNQTQESGPKQQNQATPVIKQVPIAQRIQAHMDFLADDLLKGRQTASPEYEIAARYVSSQLSQFGVEPAGDNGTWFQSVTFIESTVIPESVSMSYSVDGESIPLTYIDDMLMSANPISEQNSVTADVVFVGYGIDSDSMQHNDYQNLDVKDKIVLVLGGRPESFPSEQGAHLGSTRTKLLTAAKHGAIGYIALHTPKSEQRYPYSRVKNAISRPRLTWKNPDGEVYGFVEQIKAGGYMSIAGAEKLFAAAGSDIHEIFEQMANNQSPAGFEMGLQMSLNVETKHSETVSSNVVGVIKGSDPVLQNEYVVYSAHLDHIGHTLDQEHSEEDKDKDHINNGALDNASGIAVMLETAREFASTDLPKRSILFVAVTAEEKGLLGSSYFATNPTVPQQAMVANINLDMPLILYPFGDIIAFGAQHSSMGKMVEAAAANHDLKLSPDPMPEQAIFVRSDHYSFVKQGIPSIFLVPGWESKDPNINGGEVFQNFLKTHYHKPSDDLNLPINYESAEKFTLVNYEIGREIANTQEKPRWHEGNFFGETFASDRD